MLYGEFQRNTVDAFSVIESGRRFLGAVTPTSLLETMLQREQFLTSCLHKEIGTKQSAEGQLRQAREALSTHAEQRVELVRDHKQQLGDLSERLLSTDKRERHLLAGELHDHLAQLLAVGRIKLAQGTQITRDPAVLKIFHTLEQIFQESLNYTRTLITELSSTHLHRIGLLAALEGLTEKMQRLGLKVTLEAPQPMPDLSENHAFVLYWSLRELLFNVIKHARTNHTTVSIRLLRHSHLQCIVSDEGRGFDLQRQTPSDISPGHCGLSGIYQRMAALQGTMTMHSSPGRGTQVVLTLPLSGTSVPN